MSDGRRMLGDISQSVNRAPDRKLSARPAASRDEGLPTAPRLRRAAVCGTAKIPNSSVNTVASHDRYSPWLR